MKLSKHSRNRLQQRVGIKSKGIQDNFFKNALMYGTKPEQIEDIKLRNYLKSKRRYNSEIKLYKGWVFVYSKNSHQLYTMYKLEEV